MLQLTRFLKYHKVALVCAAVLMVCNNLMQLLLPNLMANIINNGITDGDMDYIWVQGMYMLALSLLVMGIALVANYFNAKVSMNFGMHLRDAVFVKVESLQQCDLDPIGVPSLITRTTNDIRQVQDMLIMMLRIMISAPIMLVGGAFMAFSKNAMLSSVIFIAIPIIAVIAVVVSKKIMPMFQQVQKRTDKLNQVLREKLSGIRVIRAFNRSEHEDARFREANNNLTALSLKINRLGAVLVPIVTLLLFSMIILLIGIAANQVDAMDVATQAQEIADTVGDMTAFMVYLMMIIFAVVMAAAMFVMLPRASVSAKRINEVLNLEATIRETETPTPPDESQTGELLFDHVTFRYPGAKDAILEDISFAARRGETVAVIGSTGSGKTTLMNLIPRFYDITDGALLLDGVDVRQMALKSLHGRIGFIPQKAFLFSGTVADNLRFGKEDATEEELWQALRIAQAEDFVKALPNGIYDHIAQGGKNLSGGQKQRLAIARALVKKAELYVFDDSFSALDYTTDAALRRAIKENLTDATLLIVAQRVGTVLDADRIVVLDAGKVVGVGRHSELFESCETYREIALSQLAPEELTGTA